jgi:AAA domain
MALKVEPHVDLIENFVPGRGASLIFGTPKSNKTLLSVQAAIAVASGKMFLGYYKVRKAGPVLILSQDDPDGGASVQQLFKVSPIPTKGLPIYTVPSVPFTFGVEFIEWLRLEITEKKLVFVVLDSYTKLRGSHSAGGDIVKAEQNDLTVLDELAKQTGCSILIVHHSSKGSAALEWSEQAAGTYAMAASTENQIHISRFKELADDAPERLVRIRGRHTNGTQLVLRFRPATLDHEHVLKSGSAELYPLLQILYTAFTNQPFSPKDLKQETGYSHSTAHQKIRRLLQTGLIRKSGYGKYVFTHNLEE